MISDFARVPIELVAHFEMSWAKVRFPDTLDEFKKVYLVKCRGYCASVTSF